MGKDSSDHRGTIRSVTNISALSVRKDAKDPRYFLKMQLEDKDCILLPVAADGLITDDQKARFMGKRIVYRFSPEALRDWPFAVFDLHRDCLPASMIEIALPAS